MVQIIQKTVLFKPLLWSRLVCCTLLLALLSACSWGFDSNESQGNKVYTAPNLPDESNDSRETSRMVKRDFNPKNMFGSQASDVERLDRLERMVQTLRNDFDNVSPSIKRLMVLEGDLQTLISELQEITKLPLEEPTVDTINAGAATSNKTFTKPKAVQQSNKIIYNKTPPPVQGGQATVYDVRVGEHKTKTRIVIDVNKKTNYSVSVDNDEGIMLVELPNIIWEARDSRSYRKSGYLTAYSVEETDNGYLLIFQLKRTARISYEKVLPALSGGGAQRIVLDLSGS